VILIVDDEADIRLLARLVLEGAGYDVVEAADGTEAIRILGDPGIDAMVLDLRMAPVDGWAVLEHLQALARVPGLPVVVLSAHADPAMEASRVEAGLHQLHEQAVRSRRPAGGGGHKGGWRPMKLLYRSMRWCVLVGLAWAALVSLPGMARYLKMRSM